MRRIRVSWILSCVLGIVVAAPGIASGQAVGFIAAVQGSVEVRGSSSRSFEVGLRDRDLEIGDTVRTGPASAVKILLVDETMLTLGESTEVEIESLLTGSPALREPSILRLLKGAARVVVGEAFGGPTRLEMHTPTAVVGVKGSSYEAHLIRDPLRGPGLRVYSLGGKVWVQPLDGQGAVVVIDLPVNHYLDVFAGGDISGPNPGIPPGFGVSVESQISAGSDSVEGTLFGPPGVGAGVASDRRSGPWLIVSPEAPTGRVPLQVAPPRPFVGSPAEALQVGGGGGLTPVAAQERPPLVIVPRESPREIPGGP